MAVVFMMTGLQASESSNISSARDAREGTLFFLRRGELPDTSLIPALLESGRFEDSILCAMSALSRADTMRALALFDAVHIPSRPGADCIRERYLSVAHAMGVDQKPHYINLWSENRRSSVGRRALLMILESSDFNDSTLMLRSVQDIHTWPRAHAGRWHAAVGNMYARRAQRINALKSWWKALDVATPPHLYDAAESLLVHADHHDLSLHDAVSLARILLDAERPEAVLQILSDSGTSAEGRFILAEALLSLGREKEGIRYLQRLTGTADTEAIDAAWALATYYKRTDRDGESAEVYTSLARNHGGNYRAPRAMWEAAWALERIGNFGEAARRHEELIKKWPRSPKADPARFRYGLVAWRSGDRSLARTRWRNVLGDIRSHSAKTAAGYWLGKAAFFEGEMEEAWSWWAWTAVTDPLTFYGSRAQWRLDSRWLRTSTTPVAGSRALPPSLREWAASTFDPPGNHPAREELREATFLYACGFIEGSYNALERALGQAGNDPEALAHLLETSLDQENIRIVSISAGRLANLYGEHRYRIPPLWLGRLQYPFPYHDQLEYFTADSELDCDLVAALMRKESMYQRTVRSRAGALGLMQLMPYTAAEIAKQKMLSEEEIVAVSTNLHLGCMYLHDLLVQFDNRPVFALAAYNAGPHNARRWIDSLGDTDHELWIECITYGETRDYIKRVFAFQKRYQALWTFPCGRSPLRDSLPDIKHVDIP